MTIERIGMRAPTIATPSLLKMVLALGFRMESWEGLTTGLQLFVLGQHMAAQRKFLKTQADRYAMVVLGGRRTVAGGCRGPYGS